MHRRSTTLLALVVFALLDVSLGSAQPLRVPSGSPEVCGPPGCAAAESRILLSLGTTRAQESGGDFVGRFLAASLGAAVGMVAGAYVGSRATDDSEPLEEGFYGALVGSSVGAAAAGRILSDEHSFGSRLLVTSGIAVAGLLIAYGVDAIDDNSQWVAPIILAVPISQVLTMALW